MKTFLATSLILLLWAWSVPATAQVLVVDETIAPGTVTQYEPVNQTLIVRQKSSPTPVSYSLTQATTIVDENGAVVKAERITAGVPIVVHYAQQGDQRVVSRVVIKKVVTVPAPVERTTTVEKTTTVTTTTGAGTITEYAPGSPTLILRSTAEAQPLTYTVSKTTTFVDEDGAPVAVERIAPGLPVTVHYVREGDHLVASRVVVVRKAQREDRKEKRKDKDD